MSIQIGQVIAGRYQVEAFLGKGAMAEVYRVYDRQRATSLAMKLLHADLAEDLVFIRRFRIEAQTLTTLQHPNIVRFYDFEHQGDLVFMLMDFVNGVTLRNEIFRGNGKPFTTERTLEILRPLCSALHYAHQMGVIHCDVKPANIMLDSTGRVLITDFGIARMTDSMTTTLLNAGTPAYMAPEQAKGAEPTPQTDQYALGIVLYEMLTGGQRPFTGARATSTGSTGEKVLWEKLHLAPAPPSQYNPALPPQLDAVILRCLAIQPTARYSGMLDLLAALEQTAADRKAPASKASAASAPAFQASTSLAPAASASAASAPAASAPAPAAAVQPGGPGSASLPGPTPEAPEPSGSDALQSQAHVLKSRRKKSAQWIAAAALVVIVALALIGLLSQTWGGDSSGSTVSPAIRATAAVLGVQTAVAATLAAR